ncbi:Cytochrome P450 3A4 [Bulinus truncatus]|nr:Cytochrome P450 3A4 [Bulinus truncatus]
MAVVILFMAVIVILMALIRHLQKHFSQFEELKIPGPKPNLFFGNLMELRSKGQFQAVRDWTGHYGHVFGYFEGYTPVMVVSDPDILRNVFLKDAANFMKRKPFPLAPRKSLGLFLEDGHQWKRSRSLLTPAFSTGKLKKMTPIMLEAADILTERLTEKSKEEKSIDIYSVFQSLTLDVIGRCAFGLKTNAQVDEKDMFLQKIRSLFKTMSTTFIEPIVMAAPFVSYFIFAVKNLVFLFGMNPVVWLRNSMREVIRARRALGPNSSVIDLVQLMLFPEVKVQQVDETTDAALTEQEIVAQSMTFLLAGYETTSAVLAYFCYEMAKQPNIQARLYQEIVDNVEKDINYESIQDLHYFDAVFDEVCRLYPTASFIVSRQAAEERQYGEIKIPAGMNVLANVWALHRDNRYWTEPETFNPDRFLDEPHCKKSNFTFLPFGSGPRHCIGMRFATIESKITLVKVLQKFQIEMADSTPETLELFSRGAIVPKDKVVVHTGAAKMYYGLLKQNEKNRGCGIEKEKYYLFL